MRNRHRRRERHRPRRRRARGSWPPRVAGSWWRAGARQACEAGGEIEAAGQAALAVAADVGDADDAERIVAAATGVSAASTSSSTTPGVVTPHGSRGDPRGLGTCPSHRTWTGAFLVARAALPALIERQGCIVNISSMKSHPRRAGWAAYVHLEGGPDDADPHPRQRLRPPGGARQLRVPGVGADSDGRRRHGRGRPGPGGVDRDGASDSPTPTTRFAGPGSRRRSPRGSFLSRRTGATYVNGATMPVDGGTSGRRSDRGGPVQPERQVVEHREKCALDEVIVRAQTGRCTRSTIRAS